MKRILRWIGAFVGVAVLGFLGGFILQWTKASEAKQGESVCTDKLGARETELQVKNALLFLYRARHEIGRNNFGIAGDHLQNSKNMLTAAGVSGEGAANVERAAALVAANDAAAIDPIGRAITTLESSSK